MEINIKRYWAVWKARVRGLDTFKTVEVFIDKRSIVPELTHQILDRKHLMTLTE